MLGNKVLLWKLEDHLKLVPGEGKCIIIEIELSLLCERQESFHDEEGQSLKISSGELTMIVAGFIIFQTGKEVLIELSQELGPIFERKLVVGIV
jgi:hypothetical protein